MRQNSPCIEHIEANHYRCKNRGWDIYTDVLPIFCCGKPGKRNLNAEAIAERAPMLQARDPDELTRLITVCLDCDKYDNGCPTRFAGSSCTSRRQWLKSLSSVGFRECPKWGT